MTYIRHEYDPVKAHLYYIQNRHLKGRKKGSAPPTPQPHQPQGPKPQLKPNPQTRPMAVINHPVHPDVKAATEKRVRELKARLEQLRGELKRLVEEAKKRSGAAPPTTTDQKPKSAQTKSATTKEKPRSQSEKDKAAKAAKEYYDKTHPEAALLMQIADVQKKIEKKREDLLKSVKTARRKAAVQFVSKRPTG